LSKLKQPLAADPNNSVQKRKAGFLDPSIVKYE
jgi:hypothetical protein